MTYKLYGIPNCQTVKKAQFFLEKRGIVYTFINFKKEPPTFEDIKRWKNFMKDWPVNRRGTTYRKIKENFGKANDKKKIFLVQENSSVIKRPILEKADKVLAIGYDQNLYNKLF